MTIDSQITTGKLVIISTPIGNLKDLTFRALESLRAADVIFCEDTRRSIKLLNHYDIKKPLQACPYFRERGQSEQLVHRLFKGEVVAYVSDAGAPGLSDPGSILVAATREAGYPVEVIGGVSSLTHFIAGLGLELEAFTFVGFLPARTQERKKYLLEGRANHPVIFFESPHRLESTLDLLIESLPEVELVLAKELSKISENWYFGSPAEVKKKILSTKGEWIGLIKNKAAPKKIKSEKKY